MITFINKIIALVLVPLMLNTPVLSIVQLFNQPQEVISLAENNVGSEADPIYLTAHRGVNSAAPENSIPSYEKAVELGYYSAECDIRLTSDGYWVLNHNDDVGHFMRLGNISEFTLEELRTFNYMSGANFWEYQDITIPTLDEYLDVFVGTQTRPQIEIKGDNYDMLYTVVDSVEAKGLIEQSIIISFDLEQLKVINKLNSDIELWYLVDEITEENIAEAQAIGDNVWLSANYEDNDTASIQLAVDAGIGVSFWTVNTVEDAKMLYDMGIRYIETDILCN
ncbi:MAG: hypothetical protein IJZ35_00505 [Clostridia bacterium]|nr:hypothetical protein [Clostridia bacterium]